MSDPVSWLVIEPGWTVVGADGEELGHVQEVISDEDLDIFSGLVLSHGLLGSPRWVPSDDVDEITEGSIRLRLRGEQVKRLANYEPPEPD